MEPAETQLDAAANIGGRAQPERERSWRPWLRAGAACAGLVGLWAFGVEPRWLQITRREIHLGRLPRALDGLRIAHLSDFHCSPIVSTALLRQAVRAATREHADLAVVTGDYITRAGHWIDQVTPLLSDLRARLGVYAILGNHDHYAVPDQVHAAVRAAGVPCLRNEAVRLEARDERFWLVGLDSFHMRQYRLSEALQQESARRMREYLRRSLEGVDPNAFRILLAHSPDIIPDARQARIDLVLSGHTHGGQVRLPLIGATICPSRFGARYAAGLYHEGETLLYVTRGLGTVRLPVRFLCRPELAVLTLRRGETGASPPPPLH